MSAKIDDLLTRLEEVSAQAVDSSDPVLREPVDMLQVCEFIQERGSLIKQMEPLLASGRSLNYTEWNRLVVIHHQGVRLQENLMKTRHKAVLDLGGNARGRIFLERVTSLIAPGLDQA